MADIFVKPRTGATITFVVMLLIFLMCLMGAVVALATGLANANPGLIGFGVIMLIFSLGACRYSILSLIGNSIKLSGDELSISITAEIKDKSSLDYLKEIVALKRISRRIKVGDLEEVSLGHQTVHSADVGTMSIPYFKFIGRGGFDLRVNVLVFAESGWRELLTELRERGVKMLVPDEYFKRSRVEKGLELMRA